MASPTLCGTRCRTDFMHSEQFLIGGVVRLGNTYYALTVVQPFLEYVEALSGEHWSQRTHEICRPRQVYDVRTGVLLGRLPVAPDTPWEADERFYCRDLGWALVELADQNTLWTNARVVDWEMENQPSWPKRTGFAIEPRKGGRPPQLVGYFRGPDDHRRVVSIVANELEKEIVCRKHGKVDVMTPSDAYRLYLSCPYRSYFAGGWVLDQPNEPDGSFVALILPGSSEGDNKAIGSSAAEILDDIKGNTGEDVILC
ncbi:uncharacterized protein BO97DRAFT_426682 [Aspergillus homomorphus CBS 101889]|uniref:Uncharacterized protein n=1 Tax=Aspergillus homomorphus (strain CBS 101889) TaxID=1450537 RepID=A0A395HTL0_ASPHC|nr:hypothetical protein BO97DRAFT_426682 [Aspergillus homomorphus CBS 101889]RAL10158.1 hypothetical protein BO97DRAFT_426682 [Aspergillus homomorphus CBS 101889]